METDDTMLSDVEVPNGGIGIRRRKTPSCLSSPLREERDGGLRGEGG